MLPWSSPLAGRVEHETVHSELLRDNPLGDPHERPVYVYLPPGYDDGERRYPVVYVIQGYTGHVGMWFNRAPFRRPFPELADDVFAAGDTPPAILVYVDAWTAYGGSQFLDSPATGRYHSYLCEEVVPWVDARYRTLADRAHRAIAGKSSGGYGAMITPMLRPDLFGAMATHAGDALFDVCYPRDFPGWPASSAMSTTATTRTSSPTAASASTAPRTAISTSSRSTATRPRTRATRTAACHYRSTTRVRWCRRCGPVG